MRLSRALALTHEAASATYSLDELGALLDPDLVSTALETAGVATLRKRRLPLEAMIWCVIAMALFRRMSAWDAASRMGIMLPGQKPLGAPSAIVQGRQRLGCAAVRGNIPRYLAELQASATHYVLPHRREDRSYPRAVKPGRPSIRPEIKMPVSLTDWH